jgi:glycosyltransferase involved in cell wall biosynthesis
MAGLAFARSNRPFLAWLGTPYDDDRRQRVREFAPWRKLLDRAVIRPACKAIEREVLNAGAIVPTGEYARRGFQPLAPDADIRQPIGIPVQTEWFQPDPAKVQPHTIGFAGRFNDPRKNIGLLIEATRICRERGVPVQLMLVGEKPSRAVEGLIRRSGLTDYVTGLEKLSAEALRRAYQSMSVFVVPSQQEGLCVAALEAMACGCPVVTTRCGGPEEFVTDSETGFIVPADGAAVADKITLLLKDRSLHKRLSEASRARVVRQYACDKIAEQFLQEFAGYVKHSG